MKRKNTRAAGKRAPRAGARPRHGVPSVGVSLESPTRVFISYRREDSAEAAAHLHHSLGRLLGADKIFRDVDTIPLGQNFEKVIEEAIRSTSVVLALIGPTWLTLRSAGGKRRLEEPEDFVRREIESALRAGVEIIPVLVDGAAMPARKALPPSIAELVSCNAYELPWQTGIAKLGNRIGQIERQRQAREAADRAARERLDLTGGKRVTPAAWRPQSAAASFNVVVRAMEISLARQGRNVWLSAADLARSYQERSGRSLDLGFLLPEILYIIDFLGVKAKKSSARYVARSYPIQSVDEIPGQLALGRPVLVGVRVQESWFEKPIADTGFVDIGPKDQLLGNVLGALVGWDPAKRLAKLLSPWSTWGVHGLATLTHRAVEAYLDRDGMRSIEAVPMERNPFSTKPPGREGPP